MKFLKRVLLSMVAIPANPSYFQLIGVPEGCRFNQGNDYSATDRTNKACPDDT